MPAVLLLGDDPHFVERVQHHLGALGFVALAGPTDPGEVVAAALAARPHLLLLDIASDFAFVEAASEVRRCTDIPVVHLTGRATDERIDRARPARPDAWVDDAANPRELRGALEVALRRGPLRPQPMDPRSDRLAALGSITAAMAHEINNPLTWVVGNLALVIETLTEVRDQVRPRPGAPAVPRGASTRLDGALGSLAHACEGAERIRRIVADLRDFSGPDDVDRRAVDVRGVVETALRMCGNELRHRATVLRDLGDAPPVLASPTQLGQVFVNLLVNAAQAIPAGRAEANEIRVRVDTDATGHVRIEIRDTGSGIPADSLERIFEPFFTTRPFGEGRGMGLAVAHGIVRDHGGRIEVRSRMGTGSTFVVTLPAAPAPQADDGWDIERTDPGGPARRGRVLVVDDEALVLDVVGRLLEGMHDVETFTSGTAAVERLLSDGPAVDAILCDLMMPDTPGMDVYEAVRQARPDLADRIVFVTGGAFTDRAMRFLQAIDNPHLEKPFEVGQLFRVLQKVIG